MAKNVQIRDIYGQRQKKGTPVSTKIAEFNARLEKCETALAHLTKSNDELSDIVATQQTQIAVLQRRVDMLLSREAEREAQGTEYVADQRPPHW